MRASNDRVDWSDEVECHPDAVLPIDAAALLFCDAFSHPVRPIAGLHRFEPQSPIPRLVPWHLGEHADLRNAQDGGIVFGMPPDERDRLLVDNRNEEPMYLRATSAGIPDVSANERNRVSRYRRSASSSIWASLPISSSSGARMTT